MKVVMTNRIARATFSLLVLVGFVGCGSGDGLPKRLPVNGRVTYNGAPLSSGTINFVPEDLNSGRGASGRIDNGRFRMTTMSPNDGVIPGRYRVTIAAIEETDMSNVAAQSGPGVMDQVMVSEVQQKAKRLVPERYADPIESGLTAEVERGSTSFDFDLSD